MSIPVQRASSNPRGVETVIEYNGIELHDRNSGQNLFCITQIGGLEDSDIRDSRDVNPGWTGETAYESFYGGKTLTLTGYIRSDNLNMLRSMQQDLRTAFSDLKDHDMKFRYWDVVDSFDVNTLDKYSYEATTGYGGSANLSISNGNLSKTSAIGITMLYTGLDRNWADAQSTIKFTTPSTVGTEKIGVILKRVSLNTYILAEIDNGPDEINIYSVSNNAGARTKTLLASTTSFSDPLLPNVEYRLLAYIDDKTVVAELWNNNNTKIFETKTILSGGDLSTFGGGKQGKYGFDLTDVPTTWVINEFSLTGLSPGDTVIPCRKFAPIQMIESQEKNYYKRDFLITTRSTTPSFKSAFTFKNVVPYVSTINLLGRKYNKTYPFSYNSLSPLLAQDAVVINNTGNFPAKPIFVMNGEVENPLIFNVTTNQFAYFIGTISSGNYLTFDTLNKTLFDKLGVSVFSMYAPSSTEFELAPGLNTIVVAAYPFTGNPVCDIYHQNAWV